MDSELIPAEFHAGISSRGPDSPREPTGTSKWKNEELVLFFGALEWVKNPESAGFWPQGGRNFGNPSVGPTRLPHSHPFPLILWEQARLSLVELKLNLGLREGLGTPCPDSLQEYPVWECWAGKSNPAPILGIL